MRFGMDLGWIFGGSKPEKSIKTISFSNCFCSFSKNRRFRKKYEKTSILESLLAAKTMKNREKKVLKTMCFFDIDFSSLFFDFLRFWLDFGSPGGSNNQ